MHALFIYHILLISTASAALYPKPVVDKAPKGYSQWTSPIVLPAPNTAGTGDWHEAVVKARKLVSQLTLLEKVNLTTGAGALSLCVGNTGSVPRLGIDSICLHDSPIGVRNTDGNTQFPAGITTAATFDRNLMHKRAVAMGKEFRGKGINVALAPAMDILRAPESGRIWESFGADPFLASVAAVETIQGIQSNGVIATAKHFIANNQEHYRGGSGGVTASSNVDDRTLHEIYAPPFAAAVRAGVGSVMCGYNRVNQTFDCENSKLNNGILKGEMGFQGFLVSDWAAAVSGVNSALAGLDMNMPGFRAFGSDPSEEDPSKAKFSYWGAALVEAVQNKSVPISRLDDMVTRTLAAWYKAGQDKDFPRTNFNWTSTTAPGNKHVNVQSDHKKIVRQVAAAGTVLLKNTKNILPLSPAKIKRLGVFGEDAGLNPAGNNADIAAGGNHGTLTVGWGSGVANAPYIVEPFAAIRKYMATANKKASVKGVLDNSISAATTKLAAQVDIAIVFVNADSGEGFLTVEGNAGDRNDLYLWHNGDKLIKTVASKVKNTIVVMHNVGQVDVESWISHPNVTAVLAAHLPGQETGNSIVDILFGKVNPSGRLPYTIAKKRSDYPVDVLYESSMNVPQLTYSEGLFIDYRHFDKHNIVPRFAFGYGLSYTTFAYSSIQVKVPKAKRRASDHSQIALQMNPSAALYQNAATISFKLQNTGKVAGAEVSQLYLGYPASANEPPKVLRGFEKSMLTKGASTLVKFSLTRKDVSIWDVVKQQWVVPSGTFKIYIGASSRDIRLTGSFRP